MEKLFDAVTDGIYWIFDTGWDIWTGLFSPLPYGDPYIAIAAALMIIYMAHKTLYPSNQTY